MPKLSVPLLLGALPVANLAPLTGWLFINEFDMLVLATLAVRLFLPRRPRPTFDAPMVRWWLLSGVALSAVASAWVGLFPLQPLDANAFSNYYSHYNALRVLKGFVLGFALFVLVRSDAKSGDNWRGSLVAGMVLGLAGVVFAALLERHIFPGLFKFSAAYRITATLFEMHTGGGYIETYLAAAIPFAIVAAMTWRSILLRLFAAAVFTTATYVMAVTYARAGYAGYAAAVLTLIVSALAKRTFGQLRIAAYVVISAMAMAVVGAGVALPAVDGHYMQWRFSQLKTDARTRLQHWHDTLDLIPATGTARVLGVGLGSFPERYFQGMGERGRPSTFTYRHDTDGSYVRLAGGEPVYLGQRVAIHPDGNYRLVIEFRSSRPGIPLYVSICEKSVLYSFRCGWAKLVIKQRPTDWHLEEIAFNSEGLGGGSWYQRRPVDLALVNADTGTLIDVRLVALYGEGHNDLIRNGDFSRAGDFWFFATDDHLPWHIENLFVQLRFEQGWAGVLAVGCLVVVALATLIRTLGQNDAAAYATFASISAVLVVGLFNSLLEAPRLMALLLLLLSLGAGWPLTPRVTHPTTG